MTNPAHTWTPALKAKFLDRLASHGNARAACRNVGFSPESAYRQRRRDGQFARGWAAAILLARENSEQVLAERAIDGVEEEIWHRGEHVGTRRRYDARLLLAHLARLDKLADEEGAGADAARFDELLACIAGEGPPADGDTLLPADRESFAHAAAERAGQAYRDADPAEPLPEWAFDAERDPTEEETALLEAWCAREEAECRAAAERARSEAEAEWDARVARACATVDALAGRSDVPPAPGLPGNPLPAALADAPQCARDLPPSFARTASLASTTALALSLSKGAFDGTSAWPGLDLSPRGAPSGRRSLRRSAIDVRCGAA